MSTVTRHRRRWLWRASAALAVAAVTVVVVLVGVEQWTRPARLAAEDHFVRAQTSALLPPPPLDVDPFTEMEGLPGSDDVRVLRALRDGRLLRSVWLGVRAPNGYSGPIDLAIAFDADGTIAGIDVLRHRETPGLGDVIEPRNSGWLTQFRGLSDSRNIALAADGGVVDGITSATITTRAVTDAVRRAQLLYREHGQRLSPDSGRTGQ